MLESALLTPDSKKKSNSTMNPMTLLLFSDHVVLFKRTALKSNVKQSSVYRHPPKPKYSYTVDTFIDLNELMVKRVEGNGKEGGCLLRFTS